MPEDTVMSSATVDVVLHTLPGGAILFDRGALPQAPVALFEPARAQDAVRDRGGRGEVWFLDTPAGPAVLRHYRRGGAVARLSRDRYLWSGAEQTRSFREFRLLLELCRRELPVPRPLAARFLRCDPLCYRADLLMQRIEQAESLAVLFPRLREDRAALDALGVMLARFHAAGVSHADLNAHNILRDPSGRWWLIDFDRGRLRDAEGDWWQGALARLQRSLRKLGVLDGSAAAESAWVLVDQAHRRAREAFLR